MLGLGLRGLGVRGSAAGPDAQSGTDDYLLAGRRIGTPAFVATLVATWYGGILGVGEFSYSYGLVTFLTQSLFFYIFAILFALWIAPRVRAEVPFTIPDRLEQQYGRPAAVVGAVLIYLMVSPAPYLLIVGVLIQTATGWPLWLSLLIGAPLSSWYALTGGLRAVVRTDLLQATLMIAGFALLAGMAVSTFGGWDYLTARLPARHFQATGYLTVPKIIVWALIALWTFVDPGFHQRCVAARSGAVARRGILLAVACWFAFDTLTITTGMYARAALPDIAPIDAYPMLADMLLPPVFKGLFFVALLAVAMSTVDSFSFLSAVTIGRDGLFRWTRRDKLLTRYTRIGWVVTLVTATALAWSMRSVIELWYTIGSIGLPGLLLPVLWSFTPLRQRSARSALACMLGGSLTALGWMVAGMLSDGAYPLGWEPIYPGLIAGALLFFGLGAAPATSRPHAGGSTPP